MTEIRIKLKVRDILNSAIKQKCKDWRASDYNFWKNLSENELIQALNEFTEVSKKMIESVIKFETINCRLCDGHGIYCRDVDDCDTCPDCNGTGKPKKV